MQSAMPLKPSQSVPAPLSITDAFRRQVAAAPQRIAVECRERSLSYLALHQASDAVAQRLVQQGVQPGAIVGLLAPREPEAIVAMLGILKAGAAYLPLDPSYPARLLREVCEDAEPAAVLVHQSLQVRCAQPLWRCPSLLLQADAAAAPSAVALPQNGRDDLAYLMYTSGSTGKPKGVLIPHRGVLRLVLGADYVQLDAEQVLLQLAPLSFDASTFEIWGALLTGGRLAMLAEARPSLDQIAEAIRRHGVTTLWLTAGLFHLMVDHRLDALKPLRQLLAGGDVLSPSHVDRAARALPGCRLINGYGPTENTTFSCCYSIPGEGWLGGPVPIGKPIAGTQAFILDEAQRPVIDGETGELYVGGAGLALGYHRRPELTAERFVTTPFFPGIKLYRTGDRVWRNARGELEFMGRSDRQVKINGKRVELDGIEACLRRHPQVADAAVICVGDAPGDRRLAAFVGCPAKPAPGTAELRAFLRQELPDYMLPAALRVLDKLPLTANGKLDRAVLGKLVQRAPSAPLRSASAGAEAILLDLWRDVLGTRTVSADDNFFDMGATSLHLMKLHAGIQSRLGLELHLVDLFTYPRISALATRLNAARPSAGGGGATQ